MLDNVKISLIGRGFVGDALYKSFTSRGRSVISYDKYKNIGIFDDVLLSNIVFLCLPTPFASGAGFDKTSIESVCKRLSKAKYSGLVVVKSTLEPGTSRFLAEKYHLNIAHNPEFLTARTSYDDFDSQKHIVLGKVCDSSDFTDMVILYSLLYPDAKISICSSDESESMKLFSNCFYAVKVQFFNEIYLLCNKLNIDYEKVKDLMLKNLWINPMHTSVPGPDGQLSYGGACFPKDTMALEALMDENDTDHCIISATIEERLRFRND